jgi:hypothetical protein
MALIEDILKKMAENKGFNINELPVGTKVSVNTKNSLYEFVVLEDRYVSIFGGSLKDGGVRFPKPTKVKILGSTYGGSMIRLDWVGEAMFIEFVIEEGPNKNGTILTSSVRNALIESKNGDWFYPMDWQQASARS